MDFSHNYFAGAQPYQFMGIPPLTPSHSNSAASDDFNTTSPPVSRLPRAVLSTATGGRPPPNARSTSLTQALPTQEVFDGIPSEHFQGFDTYAAQFNLQSGAFAGPPTPPGAAGHAAPQQQPPVNGAQPIKADILPLAAADPNSPDDLAQARRGGSNSDEDEMTPAQSRRKAQNRAA